MSGQYVLPEMEVLKYVAAVALGIWVGYIWISYRNRSILGYVVASAIFVGIFVFIVSYIPWVLVGFCLLMAALCYIKEKLFG
jgi:hypothetical protein